ncbi:hypothetical protein GWI33_021750 [Rhynchophorus ferrugineus]|uniref:Uncharacterized protein n=1 Tax=Rhynchophorus ferrugineus TaxID=354439 RepID=A0A834LZI9_RHYFE|nr:hypothetical protein GWI33_021750 [Rhynchophorus ferrugineus]
MMGFRSLKRVRNASYEIMLGKLKESSRSTSLNLFEEEIQLELGEMREELRVYRGELDKVREQNKKSM